ncbi:hypothetical protein ACIBO5_56420 [Nonomuraea angiospora]|uniref:hypothetical protein n=1 Tax=Nonomuraea angiospora TaxID=46172 RepID=UPI00379D9A24
MTAHDVEVAAPEPPEKGKTLEIAPPDPKAEEPERKPDEPPVPPPLDEPGSEEEQRKVDAERDRRAQGLRYFLGPDYYAGTGGAARDRTTSFAAGDAHSYHADDMYFTRTYNYYFASEFDTPPRFGGLTRDHLNLRQQLHVDTASDERLHARIRTGAVVLWGDDGTGRRDSALWALAGIVPVARPADEADDFPVEIAEVNTIGGLFPRPAGDGQPGWQVKPGRGYVLDASGLRARINRAQLDELRRAAGDKSWVIVLVAQFALAEDLTGHPDVVPHQRPIVMEVLEKHLRARLQHARPEVARNAQGLLDSAELDDEVARLRYPAEAVRLAGDLSLQLLDGATAEEVLTWLPGRRREELRKTFRGVDPRHQALPLVAAGVFQGQPVGKVVRASERLLRYVPGKRLRQDPFEDLLPQALDGFVKGVKGLDEPEAMLGGDPPVILRPESLGRDVLTVVWRDMPGLRPTLLGWLEAMVEGDDPAMCIQAAQAVGMFAVLDFDHVADTTLRRWRDSVENRHKQAFRWSLEAAAGADERTAEQVRRLLRAGAGRSLLARGTLVDAYGTRIGALFPDDALHAIDVLLRDAARRADAVDDSTLSMDSVRFLVDHRQFRVSTTLDLHRIAAIVTEIFASGATLQVLKKLHVWTGRPSQKKEAAEALVKRMVAARAMVRVARLPAPGMAHPRPPALLVMLADREVTEERLQPIWRIALADKDVGKRAWDVLRLWVEAADSDEALIEPVRAVIVPMATDHGALDLRRFHHQIQQWKRRRGGTSFRAFPLI